MAIRAGDSVGVAAFETELVSMRVVLQTRQNLQSRSAKPCHGTVSVLQNRTRHHLSALFWHSRKGEIVFRLRERISIDWSGTQKTRVLFAPRSPCVRRRSEVY